MTAHLALLVLLFIVLVGAIWSFVRQVRWARRAYHGYPVFSWWYNLNIRDGLIADAVVAWVALVGIMALMAK